MSLYVAGFVDVPACTKSDPELNLDANTWINFLPLSSAIPLTIEHIDTAQIGWTTGLFYVKSGLFCTGVVNSPEFLELLDSVYSESVVAQQHLNSDLPPNPRVEVLHSWLPELSLSSLHPDLLPESNSNNPPQQVFHHVSVCALGKRRGCVAVYGDSLQWVLSKFKSLTAGDVNNISKSHEIQPEPPKFQASMQSLFGKAIDAYFIKNRMALLKADKHTANVDPATYLKASKTPEVFAASKENLQGTSHTPLCDNTALIMTSGATSGTNAGEEMIPVPKSMFINMLESTMSSVKHHQQPSKAVIDYYPRAPAYFGSYPIGLSPPNMVQKYQPNHFLAPMEQQAHQPQELPWAYHYPMHPPNYYMWNQGSHDSQCCSKECKQKKRKRDSDEEESIFPGEESTIFKKDLSCLSKTLANLQNEIKELKQFQQMSSPPSYYGRWPYYPIVAGLPQHQPSNTSPEQSLFQQEQAKAYPPPEIQQQPLLPTAQAEQTMTEPRFEKSSSVTDNPAASKAAKTVNASSKPTPAITSATLQKLFCDELLNKQ
ncbi:protease; capsid protein [Bovine gammaherpesvirus 6]|uniref:Capsid scaffolding protein n=2 Tax=Bovine gammaherpesvirus 6 TaxID=1504288 RepID=A0A060CY05_9GAMA|nr:protease; capsid protein [Bovine gammaherpesvirus 6]AIB03171.1 protease; capsid protein [Bovine gammaherpesvirus 6]